jgi:hypothetical protein
MDRPEFDRLLDDAIVNAFKIDPDSDPDEIALELHANMMQARFDQLHARGQVTETEKLEIEAFRQAFFCYSILCASNTLEKAFKFAKATLKYCELDHGSERTIANQAVEFFNDLCSLDDLKREAARLLVDLGLPSTMEEFSDSDGNRRRIEIDLNVAKVASKAVFDSLFERVRYPAQ